MAPAHRLAVELSDQGEAAGRSPQDEPLELQRRLLNHRTTAKRFSPMGVMRLSTTRAE